MDIELTKKLAKKLGIEYGDEFPLAVSAIEWAQAGHPEQIVGTKTSYYRSIPFGEEKELSAGEYLTYRNLWDLVQAEQEE